MNDSVANESNGLRVWESKRFVVFFGLIVVAAIAFIGMTNIRKSAVKYQELTPKATPSEVCPGDSFVYMVNLEVKKPNTVVRITEDWCKLNTMICPREFVIPAIDHNARYPVTVSTPATRVVPETMPPGEWQFGHCNTSTTSNSTPTVSCYYVPITVLDCTEQTDETKAAE